MKISFFTLGCKLNQAETDELKKDLVKLGHFVVPYDSEEDICVVRGCGVTCSASQKTRNIIRHIKRQGAYVIVVGCVEDTDLAEIDFVGSRNEDIIKHIKKQFSVNLRLPAQAGSHLRPIRVVERTRNMIKIQTGCNFNCAYCLIPSFRGKAQSISAKNTITKIQDTIKNGYKEIVLTGVNICQYGSHSPVPTKPGHPLSGRGGQIDLADLLKIILDKTKIQRIRLGSLDPRLISEKLIDLYNKQFADNPLITLPRNQSGSQHTPARSRPPCKPARRCGQAACPPLSRGDTISHSAFCILQSAIRLLPHWHLSLQSGSDSVLKRMNRNYTAEKYLAIIKKLRSTYPLFSFTTDIIVGFPGETEKEFKETCDFVKKAGFAKVHIFPFSPRPGTPAAIMPNQVQDKIKTERTKKLAIIANQTAKKYLAQFKGLKRSVLFEQKNGKNLWEGYTPEYLRVKIKSDEDLTNQILNTKL